MSRIPTFTDDDNPSDEAYKPYLEICVHPVEPTVKRCEIPKGECPALKQIYHLRKSVLIIHYCLSKATYCIICRLSNVLPQVVRGR